MITAETWRSYEDSKYVEEIDDTIGAFNAHATAEANIAVQLAEWHNEEILLTADGASQETVAVISSGFANGLSPHNVLKGMFLRRSIERAGIRDEAGDTVPVMVFAAPNRDAPETTAAGVEGVAGLARRQQQVVEEHGFGKVMLLGYSQGGAVASEMARLDATSNTDVAYVATCDPANVEERTRIELARAMGKIDMDDVMMAMQSSALNMYHGLFRGEYQGVRDGGSMLSQASFAVRDVVMNKANRGAIIQDLGMDSYGTNLRSVVAKGVPVASANGSESAITTNHALRSSLQSAHVDQPGQVVTREMQGFDYTHAWGDIVELVTAHYLEDMPKEV